MKKNHEQLIVLIGILLALVLVVQGIPIQEQMVSQPMKEVIFTPEKQISSSAVASAFIIIPNTATVTVNIVE